LGLCSTYYPQTKIFYECLPKTRGCVFFCAEEKEKIFQSFVKQHGQSAFAFTGIVLAICERIVAGHHGEIKVYSSGESWSTFKVTLPMKHGSE
jgi:signal transduction histidine kinase